MKFSASTAFAFFLTAVTATPTLSKKVDSNLDRRVVEKRASVTEAASVGYATQNGGTKGGAGGSTTTVSTLAQFTAAAAVEGPLIIVIKGAITGATEVEPTSDTTIIGLPGSSLTGVGIWVNKVSNVIIRNVKITKVIHDTDGAKNGDAISIQASTNVWVDHADLSSDRSHDKDYYDGLLDVSHASDWITVSNVYFHDHFKTSLVGHSDKNGAQDTGHLHVTYANNYWYNINSRGPSIRFGTGHIFNNYYNEIDTGVNTRDGAQVLVESSVFENVISAAIESADSPTVGYAVVKDVNFGNSNNTAPAGTLNSVPYSYTKLGSANVKASVTATAGQTLTF